MSSSDLVIYKPSQELIELSKKVADVVGYDVVSEVYSVGNRIGALVKLLQHPEMVKVLENLEGSQAGFLTDKKETEGKYDAKIRGQAILNGLSQGARVVNNEINIIRGRGMLVKNFYRRMLNELGHKDSPSESCNYQMDHWYHKETLKDKGQGIITFFCKVAGEWVNKKSGKLENFDWNTEITVKFGGQYDTIDKALGQAHRRAWQEFYERYSGQHNEIDSGQFDEAPAEPNVTVGTVADAIADVEKGAGRDYEVVDDAITGKKIGAGEVPAEFKVEIEDTLPPPMQREKELPNKKKSMPKPDPELLGPDDKDLF